MLLSCHNSYYKQLWILFKILHGPLVPCEFCFSQYINVSIFRATLETCAIFLSSYCCRILKTIDKFNDLVVSVYVTDDHILNMYWTDSNIHDSITFIVIWVSPVYSSKPIHFLHFIIHTRFMLLHDSRSDDGIKSFFQEVHELYIKVTIVPCSC